MSANEVNTEIMDAHLARWNARCRPKFCCRTRERISRYFEDVELLEPGVVFLAVLAT